LCSGRSLDRPAWEPPPLPFLALSSRPEAPSAAADGSEWRDPGNTSTKLKPMDPSPCSPLRSASPASPSARQTHPHPNSFQINTYNLIQNKPLHPPAKSITFKKQGGGGVSNQLTLEEESGQRSIGAWKKREHRSLVGSRSTITTGLTAESETVLRTRSSWLSQVYQKTRP
jgi:hypothetical protein